MSSTFILSLRYLPSKSNIVCTEHVSKSLTYLLIKVSCSYLKATDLLRGCSWLCFERMSKMPIPSNCEWACSWTILSCLSRGCHFLVKEMFQYDTLPHLGLFINALSVYSEKVFGQFMLTIAFLVYICCRVMVSAYGRHMVFSGQMVDVDIFTSQNFSWKMMLMVQFSIPNCIMQWRRFSRLTTTFCTSAWNR